MRYRSLQLINAPIKCGYQKSSGAGTYTRVSIGVLVPYASRQHPDLLIELCDGEISGETDICSQLPADVVGISCNIMTYDSALKTAESASRAGSRVAKKWTLPVHAWKDALNRFAIIYENRLPVS